MAESSQFDETAWPLLVVRLPPVMNMSALASMMDGFERILRLEKRHAAVVDATRITKFPGSQERTRLTSWLADERRVAKERRFVVGNAVVVTSGPVRALLTAFNWVHRPTTPQAMKATEAEAVEWCCQLLIEDGVALTPALESMRANVVRRADEARRSP
jgi:hypothetical protein